MNAAAEENAEISRVIFRVLRNDEVGRDLTPKCKSWEETPIRDAIQDHITNGSRMDYESSLISFTAELNVAISFAGCFLRIVYVPENYFKKHEICRLDKEFLRKDAITDNVAISRSRRSDEVVIKSRVPRESIKQVEITCNSCERFLSPSFNDDSFFPSGSSLKEVINKSTFELLGSLSGANKRLLRIKIDDKNYILHSPRPNYDLEKPVLTGEALVSLAFHEFTSFCMYRILCPKHAPRCALYKFALHYAVEGISVNGECEWAVILMENFSFTSNGSEDISLVRAELYGADVLLGNWDCIGDASAHRALYGYSDDKELLRINVDRSLGCTYPEDLVKKEGKVCFPFSSDVSEFHICLKDMLKISDQAAIQSFMDLQLDSRAEEFERVLTHLSQFIKCNGNCSDVWPPFEIKGYQNNHNDESVLDRFQKRVGAIKRLLPYSKVLVSKVGPCPRDGHEAVAIEGNDNLKLMYVLGGNSANGILKDIWVFDLSVRKWHQICDMKTGLYSFSAKVFINRYIIIFGGQKKERNQKKENYLCWSNDLQVFDTKTETWLNVRCLLSNKPAKRCRQAALLLPPTSSTSTAEFIICGGWGKRRGQPLKCVWKATIEISENEATVTWKQIGQLSKPVHRHSAFLLDNNRFCIFGGFGRSIKNVEIIDLTETGLVSKTLIIRNAQISSPITSIAGFSAVFDSVENCIRVFGGDSASVNDSLSRSFGHIPQDGHKCSMKILKIGKDREGRDEWTCCDVKEHDDLQDRYRLPDFVSRSGCIFSDNRILLFGGRNHNNFSNEIFEVNIHRKLEEEKKEIASLFQKICRIKENSDHPNRLEAFIKDYLSKST